MSMFEIGLMVKELGYDGIVLYHYELPNSASVEKLMSDEDVLKICECVPGVREIDIFLTQLADDPYTFLKHKEMELQMVEGSRVQKQRSVVIEDIGCADSIPLVPYVRVKATAKDKTLKIVEQEPVEDVEDFSEPEAPKNVKGKTVGEAAKKGKAARCSMDKEVADPEPPKSVRATRSSKGKDVAEPEAPKRAKATRSSKGKGVAMATATYGEDSDASLSDASTFVDSEYGGGGGGGGNIEEIAEETIFLQQWIADHSLVEDTFQPLEDEEINEGEGGAVNEGGVVNEGEGPSGDQPLHAGPSGDHPSQAGPSRDHPSQTGQNEDQPSQTGQNREQPSRTTDFHHTNLEDTRLKEGDQAVEDELRSVHSYEDDETVATEKKFKHYNHETDKQNPIYVAWKNPTDRSLVVKYYNPNHNCVRVFQNTQASSKWLIEKFLPRIQSNPTMPPQSIVNAASSEFKVGISRMKAYRAKADALRMIEGSVAEQYAMLWDYCHELEDKNPGSTTKMQCEFVDDEAVFKRLYICLEPLKKGFKMNCRSFIGLDACHLNGVYSGQLLTGVGIDPNNETWVLAYAVVEMETRESWTWFIDLLAKDVDIVNSYG
ncbi:unnamed protein product [Prunus armeniaca]